MENNIIEFSEENILLEFCLNNQIYAVITNHNNLPEESNIYIAKENIIDGEKILRNIEDDIEFEKAKKEFERITNEYLEDEE